MTASIITCTRFSVYDPESTAWKASSALSEADYLAYLFNGERLAHRWHIFERFSIPTLIKNYESVDSLLHIVAYSKELPDSYKDKLFNLQSKYSFIKICLAGEVLEAIREALLDNSEHNSGGGVFSIARLDDDDILSPHYATSLSRYLHSEFSGFIVSFPLGYTGIFSQQNNHYYYLRECYVPKIAIGLSAITPYSRTIDNKINFKHMDFKHILAGSGEGMRLHPGGFNHMLADRKYPVILDASQPMYFRSRSVKQDTRVLDQDMKIIKTKLSRMPVVSCDDVTRLFTIPCSDEQS